MAPKSLIFLAFVVCLALYVELSTGVMRTLEKDEYLNSQYKLWCSRDHVHRCKYERKDYEYFKSLCNDTSYKGFSPRRIGGSRKEYRCMSRSEREGYHAALVSMKNNREGGQSQYDGIAVLHDSRTAPSAHFSPGFCPWHRVYLHIWERAVRRYCGSCYLPYWDSRLDARLGGNPQDSVIFSPQLAGNADGIVRTGFAANWRVSQQCSTNTQGLLARFFATNTNDLYSDSDANFGRDANSFQDMAFPWDNTFEFTHGYLHMAFGTNSQMSDILCSPFDPMFISHHCFVEKLCEDARLKLRGRSDYPDVNSVNFRDLNDNVRAAAANNVVRPFDSVGFSVTHRNALLQEELNPDWYNFERSPGDVRCQRDEDCCANGSTDFIWCNRGRCVSKAQSGGRISAAYPSNACYCETGTPRNANGVCACN